MAFFLTQGLCAKPVCKLTGWSLMEFLSLRSDSTYIAGRVGGQTYQALGRGKNCSRGILRLVGKQKQPKWAGQLSATTCHYGTGRRLLHSPHKIRKACCFCSIKISTVVSRARRPRQAHDARQLPAAGRPARPIIKPQTTKILHVNF